jgi:hypothetical protein
MRQASNPQPCLPASSTTTQSRNSNQPYPVHKNPSSNDNSSSLCCTPFFKHTFMDTTVANKSARLCRSSHETATASTGTGRCITQLENKVHQAMAVMDKDRGKLLNYGQLMNSLKYKQAWSLSAANKFWQSANGIGGCIKNPTNTIEFIFQRKVPADCINDITHGQFICTIRPEKAKPNQMRFMVAEDRINYPGEVATPIKEMLVAKMFNSVIFMKGTQFMTMGISNFYFMTPLHHAMFILIKLSDIPNEDVNEYKLREKTTKIGNIYIRAKRRMYSLPQAGLLANKLLKKHLSKHGYQQSK